MDETMISTLTTMMRAIGDNEFHSASEQFARLAQMKLKTLIETYLAAYQKALKKKGYISDYLFTNALDLEAARCEQEFQSWMTEERAEFETFIKEFRDFVLALAKDPPETSSGLTKPRKRTQIHYLTHPRETITHPRKTIMHPQRTHADMQNEIEKELVHLPQYTARVKLTDANDTIAERTLATREPEKGLYGRLLEDRVERIKLHNRTAGYTRPRQEVEVEIKMRQNTLRQAQQLQVQKEPLSLQRRFLIEPQPVQPIASDSHLEQELMKLWREAVNKGLTSLKFEDWREQPEQKLLITWVKKLIGS